MFLIPQDYNPYIRTEIKEDILINNLDKIKQVELAAQSEMSSYLRGRYDIGKVFPELLTFIEASQYAEGVYVVENGKVYLSLEAQTGNVPSASSSGESATYKLEDPRNPIIVLRMVYITLYHAHKSLPGSQIPQLRIDDYDMSIRWLEKVAQGLINPFTEDFISDTGGIASWGSEERRNNRY